MEKSVRDIMSKVLISVDPATTIFQVAKMMEQGIGAVLVKKEGVPAGIITDRDYAIKVMADNVPSDTPVEKVASYPLITVSADATLKEAASQMSTKKIRKLVVVDAGAVIGIITATDLVAQMSSQS